MTSPRVRRRRRRRPHAVVGRPTAPAARAPRGRRGSRSACCHPAGAGPAATSGGAVRCPRSCDLGPWHAVRPMAARHQTDPEHLWHYSEDPAHRALRAARPGHQPGPAADGLDDRRRPCPALLVPARLPPHHVLDRRRLTRRPARRRPPRRGCTPSRRAGSSGCERASSSCTGSRSTGSGRGPTPTATGWPTTSARAARRRAGRRPARAAPRARHRAAGPRRPAAAPRRGDRVGLPVLDEPDGEHQSCSGRSVGNRMTSRIDVVSVRSITRRSMPMPRPAVGGRPYSRARR